MTRLDSPFVRSAVVALGVMTFWFGAVSGEASQNSSLATPYLDQMKAKLGTAPSAEGSYTEELKRKLGATSSPSVSYTEELKKKLTGTPASPSPTSFTEERKKKLLGEEPPQSAIQAVAEGRSELKARKSQEIHYGVSFRVGASITRNITSTDASVASRDFSSLYGTGWSPDLQVTGEWQPFHSEWFGNVALVAGTGIASFRGKGVFSFDLTNPASPTSTFGTDSRTVFRYLTAPLWLGANYRFNLFRMVRPYVQGGAGVIGSMETREDSNATKSALSRAVFMNAGACIWLDPLLPSASWNLYSENGVKHYSLIVDYARVLPVGSGIRIASQGISLGFLYEF